MAVFDGIRRAGHPVQIETCDLTDRRMYVRARCEAVQVLAPGLLAGYRSSFTGAAGADNPVVFAGFVVTNSETGCGAATVTPRIIARVCSNGMTITRDAIRAVHLGERMDEGIQWSSDTLDRQLELVTAKARDAVTRIPRPRLRRPAGAGDGTARGPAGPPGARRARRMSCRRPGTGGRSAVTVTGATRADRGLLRSALDLAARGWHVIPCACGGKRPALSGNWQDLATTDTSRVGAWWTRTPYNIGIACGPSGLIVIDLDIAHGEPPGDQAAATG